MARKSKIEKMAEVAVAAVNLLIVAQNTEKVPGINPAYLAVTMNAGRLEEAAAHLVRATEKIMQGVK